MAPEIFSIVGIIRSIAAEILSTLAIILTIAAEFAYMTTGLSCLLFAKHNEHVVIANVPSVLENRAV
jgi:hypothetical protein